MKNSINLCTRAALVALMTSFAVRAEPLDPAKVIAPFFKPPAEFADKFGPSSEDYAALQKFAADNGLRIVDKTPNRMVLNIEAPAATIESAVHVSMNLFQHPTEARTFFSADREPTLDLDVPILHITGLDDFDLPHAKNIVQIGRAHV